MEEENKTEENVEDSSEADETASEEAPISTIDRANLAADRMEKANVERARLLRIEEKLAIERKLGGSSEAGTATKKPAELTPTEYRKSIEAGIIPK